MTRLNTPDHASAPALFAHGSRRHSPHNRQVAQTWQRAGSAAALMAAADLGPRIAAVVSRGDRPNLAGPAALKHVAAQATAWFTAHFQQDNTPTPEKASR